MVAPDLQDHVRATRVRALQTVRRTIVVLIDLVDQNRRLADNPDHRMSAEQRISEGETELEELRRQEAELIEAIDSADREKR